MVSLEERMRPVEEWDVLDLSRKYDSAVIADMHRIREYLIKYDRDVDFGGIIGQLFADMTARKSDMVFTPANIVDANGILVYDLPEHAKKRSQNLNESKTLIFDPHGLDIFINKSYIMELADTQCISIDNVDNQLEGISIGSHLITKIKNDKTLFFHFVNTERSFTEAEKQLIYSIGKNISRKFWNTSEAMLDPLTKAINQTYWNRVLTEKIKRSKLQNQPYSILLADIDKFKNLNEEYGHATVDGILGQMATIFKENIRGGEDVVARYAGDEFVFFLKTDSKNAKNSAEKINQALKNHIFYDHNENPLTNLNISLSIGLISSSQKFYRDQILKRFSLSSPDNYLALTQHLVALADDATNYVKNHGKNGVEIFKPEMMREVNKKVYVSNP